MSAPTLHDLKFVRDALDIQLPDSWVIPTSKSDDVIWNIVLAYINSFPLSDENELTRRIKCLIEDQEVNQNIIISIEMCNPFLDRDSCFSDKEMSNVVTKFKKRVEDYINNGERLFRAPAKYFRYLEASSKLLSCNIVFISLKDRIATVFPAQTSPNPGTNDKKHISILGELNSMRIDGSRQDQFSFCIPKEIGLEKKRQALTEILKRTRMFDNKGSVIQKVNRLPDITENFLISLLKNDLGEIITFIYKSPYVLSNLADAGFETDPRTKDNTGKSAFFHALKTEESQLVFLLYDHAANACSQTDASSISENLLCIKEYLKLLGNDLESEEMSEKSRRLFRDSCRFNEFQIEICESINKIRRKYSKTNVVNHEVSLRKEILLAILKTYETYFHYTNGEAEPSVDADDNISRFKEFYKRREYFDKLDFTLAVMLFDHLFLLKERLTLPDNAYLDVESNFFLFIFFRKYIEQYEKQKRFYSVSRWITFQERLSLQRQMCNFKKILEGTELSDDNIVKPGKDYQDKNVSTLIGLPEFFGQFLISRMQHYFNATTGLTVKDLKSVLVIERCLQVMGECCKRHDFNSVQKILTLSLSKKFSEHLYLIRHELSHITPEKILYRYELEKDKKLFEEIQKELVKIIKLLIPLNSASKYQQNLFLLLHSVEPICKFWRRSILEVHENQLKAKLPSQEIEESEQSIPTYTYCCQNSWKRYLEDIHSFLLKEIYYLNYKGNILHENTASGYKLIVKKIISAIEEVLKVAIPEKTVEIDSHFWCLENILTYIATDKKLAECRKKLKLIQKDRTEAERDRVRDHLSSKPENSSQQAVNSNDPFIKFGVLLENNNKKGNDINDNGFSHNKTGSLVTNQVDNEINRENSGNSILRNICDDCMLLKMIDTLELEEVAALRENGDDSETINLTKKNDLFFEEASAFSDDSLRPLHDCLVNGEVDIRKEIKDTKRKHSIEDARTYLDDYKRIARTIFHEVPDDSNEDLHLKISENYFLILEGKNFLKKEEKELILGSVSEKFRNIDDVKQKIRDILDRNIEFTEELNSFLSLLKLKDQEIRDIKKEIEDYRVTEDTLRIVNSASGYFLYLKEVMESKKLDESEYKLLCDKLELSDDAKNILFKLVPKQEGNKLEFLRNRINKLKNILIEENNAIQQLWKRATTPRRKMHVKEKLVQLYLKDFEIQASVETLLFHCMTISRNKELKKLWKKTTNLFNGINLRNILAHGHPLLESLGTLLNPFDLPSELVGKMLQLISDEYIIDCMLQIIEQSGTDLDGFRKIMNDKENEKFRNLRKQISKCDRWESYAVLIPVYPKKKCSKSFFYH
ncbi:hypothetical protein AVEN_74236-1 [Araneus ventricosus]|uniref:Uncharacterized protein n=1 Tax=Araneus ventricosus TaxID=182803 RepID=A0A4Y2EVJ0_ARAVE|nr:hypothetical protein AVEN_74236-1 [Araneus ventricosus]